MPNYFIIGGDGKEYGPITEADIRLWISEGRLNTQTSARAEAETNWRPLGTFPEFTAQFQGPPPTINSLADDSSARTAALNDIKAPAISLKVAAIINALLSLWSLMPLIFFQKAIQAEYQKQLEQYPQLQDSGMQKWLELIYGPLGIGSNIFALVMAAIIFWGAIKMQQLKSYELAFTAAILAMLPCVSACCILGLPFGIWALVVMRRKEVKSQFK
jgi:hypothetical protein